MKDLCTRARAAMNLLLLFSLLQIWILASVNNWPDKLLKTVTMQGNNLLAWLPDHQSEATIQTNAFIEAFR